ncbi:MAG: hypothetical protein AAGA95_06010 [Pseudomonadota bacterium]
MTYENSDSSLHESFDHLTHSLRAWSDTPAFAEWAIAAAGLTLTEAQQASLTAMVSDWVRFELGSAWPRFAHKVFGVWSHDQALAHALCQSGAHGERLAGEVLAASADAPSALTRGPGFYDRRKAVFNHFFADAGTNAIPALQLIAEALYADRIAVREAV